MNFMNNFSMPRNQPSQFGGYQQSLLPTIDPMAMAGYGQPLTQGMQALNIQPQAFQSALTAEGVPGMQGGGGIWDSIKNSGFLGSTDAKGVRTDGWGGAALGAAQGLMSGFMGMKQYGLMKDQLAEGKRRYNKDYEAQKRLTNAQLEDRQRARVSSSTVGTYESVGDYMQKHGIK